jgi:drug/metabolite transporter (DMT)-like permease
VPVVVAYITCALVWGTTWFAIRASTGPDGFPTIEAAAIRFAIAAVVLAPFVLLQRLGPWPRTRRAWAWLVVAGLLDALAYALVYLGEERVAGGLAAVLFATQPLMLAGLLTATGMERVRRLEVIGAVVALVGVAILFADRWQVSSRQAAGLAMLLGAVGASSSYSLIMKREGAHVHALVTTLIFLTVTALGLGAAVVVRGVHPLPWPPPRDATLALLYLAIMGSVVAFATWLWLLQRLSLMAMSTLSFVLPIVALVVDALWEHEVQLVARSYVGIAVVLGGLAIALGGKRRRL